MAARLSFGNIARTLSSLIVLLICITLCACGQTGELYLPDDDPSPAVPPSSEDAKNPQEQ